MKALAVGCHCDSRGVDEQHQLRLRRMEGDLCMARGLEVPPGHGLARLLFFGYVLTPFQAVFSVWSHCFGRNAVMLSCTLNAVKTDYASVLLINAAPPSAESKLNPSFLEHVHS